MDDSSQQRWYVTFGSQYSYQMHPYVPVIHPDAVVEIVAPDYAMARELTVRMFGQQWSDLHEWDEIIVGEFYPAGVAYTVHYVDPEISDLVVSIDAWPQEQYINAFLVRPAPERELVWGDSAYAQVARNG